MLSILIPTYNYNTYTLVCELKKQADLLFINYEILVQEDAGTLCIDENLKINDLTNCSYKINTQNLGRGNNLNSLVIQASFDNVLILDCDVYPKSSLFLKNYLKKIEKNYKIVFGGIAYKNIAFKENEVLRYKYGINRESKSLQKRLKNPQHFLTSNILINKTVINFPFFEESIKTYGYEDLVFAKKIAEQNIVIDHIENEVYHLNLETSEIYLEKTEVALKNLHKLIDKNIIDKNATKISKVYFLLSKYKMTFLLSLISSFGLKPIKKNILSENPNLLLFDLYKLMYLNKLISK